jgi:hypothetical protein
MALNMPSQRHEALLYLFRNRPALAPDLLRDALHAELPEYSEVRIESADLSTLRPPEYRADLVLLLYAGKPVRGIIVEVQLKIDTQKQITWPHYATSLRARILCPVDLLVVTVARSVARWAAQPVYTGGTNYFVPYVLGPQVVPEVTDERTAIADPELAVLSAMAHGRDRNAGKASQIALAALCGSLGLDDERSRLYVDLVEQSLSKAARKALQMLDPAKYEYKSEFARRYLAQGRKEGRNEGHAQGREEGRTEGHAQGLTAGRVEVLLKVLRQRFGNVSTAAERRLRRASSAELDRFTERVLTAVSVRELMAP